MRYEDLRSNTAVEPSSAIRERVMTARRLQLERFASEGIYSNALMKPKHIKKHCRLGGPAQDILDKAIQHLGLSARAYHRILKVSRTIADLAHVKDIGSEHIMEAVQYRTLDRKLF